MRGRAEQVTQPTIPLISTDDAKTHLREDSSSNDSYIDGLVSAAVSMFERDTERQLITATWEYYLDAFPGVIYLPYGKVQTVNSVSYYDSDGNLQVLSDSLYDVSIEGDIARIQSVNSSWPSTDEDTLNAVIVNYDSGYGDNPTDVPADIIAAVKLILGDLYTNREDFAMKRGYVKRIVDLYKIYFND